MTQEHLVLSTLSDTQLLAEVERLAHHERHATVALVRSLAELDARRLFLREGYSSLFSYCTQALHLGEHAALSRIEVARAARRLPLILEHLAEGLVTLTNVRLLAPHLTPENHLELLASARHKSKREVEEIVARLRPQPDVSASVRRLPAQRMPDPPRAPESMVRPIHAPLSFNPESTDADLDLVPTAVDAVIHAPKPNDGSTLRLATPSRFPVVAPRSPERYKLQVTISREAYEMLRRAQELVRHADPAASIEGIVTRGLALLVEQLERAKCAATSHPRRTRESNARARYISASVRRDVWRRDQGQCAFVGTRGRCPDRGFLEFHHVQPHAAGGANDASNIQLRCRAHNAYEAELFFGTASRPGEASGSELVPERVG